MCVWRTRATFVVTQDRSWTIIEVCVMWPWSKTIYRERWTRARDAGDKTGKLAVQCWWNNCRIWRCTVAVICSFRQTHGNASIIDGWIGYCVGTWTRKTGPVMVHLHVQLAGKHHCWLSSRVGVKTWLVEGRNAVCCASLNLVRSGLLKTEGQLQWLCVWLDKALDEHNQNKVSRSGACDDVGSVDAFWYDSLPLRNYKSFV